MDFQAQQIAPCHHGGCPKPATHRIVGHPGNVDYGYACARHADARCKALSETHR